MASGVTATAGTYLFGRVAAKVSTQRLIVLVGVGGSLTVLLLGLTRDPWSFTLVRMCQAGLISAILPLTFSLFAQQGGGTIGTLNSSRFAGNAIGPLAGTLLLSYGSPLLLYGVLAAFTLTVLLAFWGLAEVS
jgi:MFS family permease